MKLLDILILSLSIVFLIIGIHQIITQGIGHAYWAVMLATVMFFIFTYRKGK